MCLFYWRQFLLEKSLHFYFYCVFENVLHFYRRPIAKTRMSSFPWMFLECVCCSSRSEDVLTFWENFQTKDLHVEIIFSLCNWIKYMALGKHYSNVIDIFFEKMIHILQLKKSWKLSQFCQFLVFWRYWSRTLRPS